MSSVFYRTPSQAPRTAVSGAGVYLYDAQGQRYLDGSGGAAVSCLGHAHPQVIAAIQAQAAKLPYAHTAFFTSTAAEQLADTLIRQAPTEFGKVYFLSGGSEAMETAMKLARSFHLANGEHSRSLFISRRQSYHGNTLGALSISRNPARRKPYEPLLTNYPRIAPCYAYREQRDDESATAYAARAADELEAAILAAGAENVAAFVAETVVGATLGACPAVPGYFTRIRAICDRYGVLYIADEVMCGMGRTGYAFATEHEQVTPDLIVVAKGLAGGYQPLGAVLMRTLLADALTAQGFEHGHTYSGHPTACAAALAVQTVIEQDGLLPQVRVSGEYLRAQLTERLAPMHVVGEIRGRGLLLGIELVNDPATKLPFEPGLRVAARLKEAAMTRGLICYPGSGCIDGTRGDHILLAPAYLISRSEMDELTDRLTLALQDLLTVIRQP
ncbi:MAG: aspartate aminotransferase family protein [Steroidobacteraceae bacterium]